MQLKKLLLHRLQFAFLIVSVCLLTRTIVAQKTSPSATPGERAPAAVPVPGLDPTTGVPLYKTIVENWSSLQIGDSHLLPLPPIPTPPENQDTFTRQLVRLQWRPGDPIDLWVILPKGAKKPPVVLYLYGVTEDTHRFRNDGWCERVTGGGVAAVGFVSALTGERFHDRPMKQWFVSELQESLGSTVHDVKFILDYLEARGDIDTSHSGIFGEGSGGAIAILAAAADPRIKAVDALDPWGDWPDFLAKSSAVQEDPNRETYLKPEFLKQVAPLDPVKWLPQLKAPIRIQQVRDNDATPMEVKEAVRLAAPPQAEVVRFAGSEDLAKRQGRGQLFTWIKEKVQPAERNSAPGSSAKTEAEEHPAPSAPSVTQKRSHK